MTGQRNAADTADPAWGTTDPDEQVLWAFGQQDYRFCIERINASLNGGISFWQLQLLMISLQRCGRADIAAEFGASALSGYVAEPWASACVRLTLGEGSVDAALIAASSDAERWMSWFWEWSRALTAWQRQAAWRAHRECEALDRAAGAPIEVRERMLLRLEAAHFTADSRDSQVLAAAGVAVVEPKREMRVFISSTFRDLRAEREALVSRVFPEIRVLCKERAVLFSDVDLRWGITDAQAAEGDVLPLCLAAIDQCRPYFIGLIGARYGWRPERIDAELLRQHGWLAECAGSSVTEIEFRHGVLNDPSSAKAVFYLLPAEPPAETGEPSVRLQALRRRLRNGEVQARDIATTEELIEVVRQDLIARLDNDFPADQTPSWLELEGAQHEALALDLGETYIGRWDMLSALDDWALEDGPPLLVAGGGRGVTSLLAEWGRRWRHAHPSDVTVLHFVGASDDAGVWPQLVSRFIAELALHTDIDVPTIDLPMRLPAILIDMLRNDSQTRRVVLVLDGLHQLDPTFGGPDLDWLPRDWPAGVRLVLSTSNSQQAEKLAVTAVGTLVVRPLEPAERAVLIREMLQRWGKSLDDDRIEQLAAIEAGGTPAFLRVLLEELRLVDSHEALPAQIDRLAGMPDLVTLLGHWLERLEHKHGAPLVAETMRLLWASRRGRTDEELRDALGDPFPQRLWLPLSMDLAALLRGPQDRLWLPSRVFHEAVTRRYLPDDESQRHAILTLADHLGRRQLDAVLVRERPDLLRQAGDWEALAALLTEPGFFFSAWLADPPHIKQLWTAIEAASTLRRADAYGPWLDGRVDAPGAVLQMLAQLLAESGLYDAATAARAAVPHNDDDDPWLRARDHAERARVAYLRGELDTALQAYRDEESIWLAEGDADSALSARSNQALVLKDQGFLDTALTIQQEAETRWRESSDDAGVAMSLGNQGVIFNLKGDFDSALRCHDEELALYGALGDPQGRQRALANRALALRDLGRIEEALTTGDQAVDLARNLGNLSELAAGLRNQGTMLFQQEGWADAQPLLVEAADIFGRLGRPDDQGLALHHAGESAQKRNDADAALTNYAAAEVAYRAADDLNSVLAEIFNQAMILHMSERPRPALERYRAAEVLARDLGERSELVRALANDASLLVGPLKDPRSALAPIEEAARLVQPDDPPGLLDAVAGLRKSIRRQVKGK